MILSCAATAAAVAAAAATAAAVAASAVAADRLFVPSLKSEDGIAELHRGHTHSLYFLAQVFKEMDQTDLVGSGSVFSVTITLAQWFTNPECSLLDSTL